MQQRWVPEQELALAGQQGLATATHKPVPRMVSFQLCLELSFNSLRSGLDGGVELDWDVRG